MTVPSNLVRYYAERANEYEKVYLKPERQQDIARLKILLRDLLRDYQILEVACGTGYWTTVIAEVATSIVATDINAEVLRIAQDKQLSTQKVQFVQADAFSLSTTQDLFTAGFAGFWWSHILKSQLGQFLDVFHAKLASGALVVFTDNTYVEGSNHPITHVDGEGNTYQQRRLENGKLYEVLKNFPDESEFQRILGARASNLRYERLTYYWCLSYTLQ
jgi:demethylmenaquinone methyltransferase/2-methoxy-6-polyprenyl-1,4-benzoquinol methylase